jgi:streptolysin S family bacteriocin protoxin
MAFTGESSFSGSRKALVVARIDGSDERYDGAFGGARHCCCCCCCVSMARRRDSTDPVSEAKEAIVCERLSKSNQI